jgi:riboflavin synthase
MFTGIIEEIGKIEGVQWGERSARIKIQAEKILSDVKVGDSINTNGSCLTVTAFDSNSFTVDVMAETMRRTNLGDLKTGSQVNLERALKLSDRLGGHLVSGHIDGVGNITQFSKEDNATWIKVKAESGIMKYIIFKGSVALDGVSLTVAEVTNETFSVSIIPHTSSTTTLLRKQVGNKLNIECDMVGKYIEKFTLHQQNNTSGSKITMDFLKDNGFM